MAKHGTYKKRRGGQMMTTTQPSALEKISSTVSEYGTKAKNSVVSGATGMGNWFSSLTKPSPSPPTFNPPLYKPATMGGKRKHRYKTKKYRRGGNGNMVKSYNTYNDSFTANTTPVSGYQTAMPQNWVGGRKCKTRGGKRCSRRVR